MAGSTNRYTPGKIATTGMLNRLVRDLESESDPLNFGTIFGHQLTYDFVFFGQIHYQGPSGESDYTDNRYWVMPKYIKGATVSNALIELGDEPFLAETPQTYTVVNLGEQFHTKPGGSHVMRRGDIVPVSGIMDVGVDDNQRMRLVMFCSRPQVIRVSVEADGGADGTSSVAATWTYTVRNINDTIIGTAVPLVAARPKGKRLPGSQYGLATYDDFENLILIDAGEVEDTGTCPA